MGETGSMILFGLPQKIAKFIVLKSPFQVAHLQNHGGADWPPSNRRLFRLICGGKKDGKVQSSFSSRFAQSPKGNPLECNLQIDFKTSQNITTRDQHIIFLECLEVQILTQTNLFKGIFQTTYFRNLGAEPSYAFKYSPQDLRFFNKF